MKTPFSHLENATGKHKDWYNSEFFKVLCDTLNSKKEVINFRAVNRVFIKEYATLELKDRLRLIARLLDDGISGSYKKKLSSFKVLLGKKWPHEEGLFNYAYHLYPISQFIEDRCVEDLDSSLKFIEELTQRFTGEWAIRSILSLEPQLGLKKMKEWSHHESFHVRRLSSEGLRIRLPWGQKVKWISENPQKTLSIYNRLRNDSSQYVRRSVANSIGDLIKVNEELARKTIEKWLNQKKTRENLWVIKHAIRHPDKLGIQYYSELRKEISELIKSK